jgi:aminoglycoside phosphotransferase (APT) family kinase protein
VQPLSVDRPDTVRDEAGIDRPRLAAYLEKAVPGVSGPMELLQFHAGHSNLTYLARFGDRELVVKRAPLGHRAKSAHDMEREFHVLSRLHGAYRYAPKAFAYCGDTSIAGSPFCVMERTPGIIVRGEYPPHVSDERIALQFEHLVDGLVELHALDVAAAGLVDFGRPLGYRRRQVEGWGRRLDAARTDDLVDFAPVRAWLAAHMPQTPERATLVHNDFKLDNLVWESNDLTALKAVLDWEMATLGDGALDLACTLSFWPEPGDPPEFLALRAMPTLHAGVPTRREVLDRYARSTAGDVPDLAFLLCFGYFRRAVIEQQKYVRFKRGDSTDPRFAHLDESVRILHGMCLRAMG